MALYAIHAYEATYGGLHGFENHFIVDMDSYEDACEEAEYASIDIIESNPSIMESFYRGAEAEGLEDMDFDEYINDCFAEDVAYEVFKIKNEYAKGDIAELERKFINNKEDFVRKYCE